MAFFEHASLLLHGLDSSVQDWKYQMPGRPSCIERWPRNDKRAYVASLDAIIGWVLRERLALITCPTLVIRADQDYTPVALKQAYVRELPDARLEVVANSRHATPLDQPQRFNTLLLDFLDQH